jgi:hypothetical protein
MVRRVVRPAATLEHPHHLCLDAGYDDPLMRLYLHVLNSKPRKLLFLYFLDCIRNIT